MNISKIKPVQKAYAIDYSKIKDGYLGCFTTVTAETPGKARKKLFDYIKYDGYELYQSVRLITYLNLPIVRVADYDLIVIDGKEVTRNQAERIIRQKEHDNQLDAILRDDTIEWCYIRKHGSYYCDNMSGYTERIEKAGIYSKQTAVNHARGIMEITVKPIDIQEHNEYLTKLINQAKAKLL